MLLEPVASEKAIKAFSFRVMRRLFAAGDRSLQIEDVQQELRMAWLLASQSYNAETGVPFQAYLINGMRLRINRVIEKNVERRHQEVLAVSLDKTTDEGGRLADAIPNHDDRPGIDFEEQDHFDSVIRHLKPRARQFVTLLRQQPVELLAEVSAVVQKNEFGRETMGVRNGVPNRLTASLIFDLMDASMIERGQILREVRALGDQVCREMSR